MLAIKGIFMVVALATCVISFAMKDEKNQPKCGRIDDTSTHSVFRGKPEKAFEPVDPAEKTADFWIKKARETIRKQLNRRPNTNQAKNVILFLGDGMSIPTIAAARVYLAQKKSGKTGAGGEEEQLSFEKFPYTGLSKTYCVDVQVADSACTATAYLGGVKANTATTGVTAAVKLGDCTAMRNENNHVYSIGRDFQLAGKKTGIVTTSRITHASPSGVYTHIANRDWESDTDITKDGVNATLCRDIAYQLVHGETGKNVNVAMGGGRWAFFPKGYVDEEGYEGHRSDGKNLVREWTNSKIGSTAAYVTDRNGLLNISDDTEYVLGLFATDHIPYNLDRDVSKTPSLQEMTEKAIKLLSNNDTGYFLFVEGARIDMAHHESLPRKSLEETIEFHKAIEAADNLTSAEDTLIIVTSDHSHTLSINGYPERGNDILGFVGKSNVDLLPYTTLSYANGPGYRKEENGKRHDMTNDNLAGKDYKFPGLYPLKSESHGGDDVGIFARGPWAHLLDSVVEQNVIPHVMAHAACVGSNPDNACTLPSKGSSNLSSQHFYQIIGILLVSLLLNLY